MKTFKWTVREMPMTDRERIPPSKNSQGISGLGWIIAGTMFSLFSWMYFSTSSGFLKGLRTYFWESTTGTIVSSELRMHSRSEGRTVSGSGTVGYTIEVDGQPIEGSDEVFKRWDGDMSGKYEEWSERLGIGRMATIYFNRSGETSLGRWPASYSYQFGIQGVITLLMGLSFVCRGVGRLRANRAAQSSLEHAETV